jgi:sarcosine oxidase, subunit alpha
MEVLGARGARVLERTLCLSVTPDGKAMIVGPSGGYTVRWDRLILATGAYDRPLLYRGNDLPGTVGVRGFEALAAQGAFAGRSMVFVGAPDEAERARRVAEQAEARSVTVSEIPSGVEGAQGRLLAAGGRRRVRWVEMDAAGRVPCDVLVLGFSQPTYELQAQAGWALRVEGSPPIITAGPVKGEARVLVVGEAAGWHDPAAAASAAADAARAFDAKDHPPTPPRAPDLPSPSVPHPDAYVCWCEDVRVRDVERAVDEGFSHVELIKRRTGATTGPCQGKLCLGPVLETLRARGLGDSLPTVRPPVRPVSLAWLGGGIHA